MEGLTRDCNAGIANGTAGSPDITSDQSLPEPKSAILVLIIHITDGERGQHKTREAIAHYLTKETFVFCELNC